METAHASARAAAGAVASPDGKGEALCHDMVGVLMNYRSFLGFLARLFYSPLSQEELDSLKATDLAPLAADPESEGEAMLAEGVEDMVAALESDAGDQRLWLNVDYTSAFYGVNQVGETSAVPCESVFAGSERRLYGELQAIVFNSFKRDALKLREGLDVPDDHLSFELQYVAVMCKRAAEALEKGDSHSACLSMDKAAAFSRAHILNWIGDLGAALNGLVKCGFYPGLVKATRGFVTLVAEGLESMAGDCRAWKNAAAI